MGEQDMTDYEMGFDWDTGNSRDTGQTLNTTVHQRNLIIVLFAGNQKGIQMETDQETRQMCILQGYPHLLLDFFLSFFHLCLCSSLLLLFVSRSFPFMKCIHLSGPDRGQCMLPTCATCTSRWHLASCIQPTGDKEGGKHLLQSSLFDALSQCLRKGAFRPEARMGPTPRLPPPLLEGGGLLLYLVLSSSFVRFIHLQTQPPYHGPP